MPRCETTSGGTSYSAAFRAVDEMGARGELAVIDGLPSVWNGRHWATGTRAVERALLKGMAGAGSKVRSEALSYIKLTDSVPHVKSFADGCRYISFSNGAYDIDSGDFVAEEREMYIPVTVPVRFDESAHGGVDEILGRWGPREDLGAIAGSAMAAVPADRIFLLTGHGGEGKSTFLKMLGTIAGCENAAALGITDFTSRFATSFLVGKTVNLGNDLPSSDIDATLLKTVGSLATGDSMSYEFKYGSVDMFEPYVTMVYTSNPPYPHFNDTSGGFKRRLSVVPFERAPEGARCDDRLAWRFANDVEMQAELATYGARMLTEHGTAKVGDASAERRIWSATNSVASWLEEREPPLESISRKLAYDDYCEYCAKAGIKAHGRNGFGELVCDAAKMKLVKTMGEYRFKPLEWNGEPNTVRFKPTERERSKA